MPTFATLKTNLKQNLNDSGAIMSTQIEVDDSTQDAYDDIVAQTQCIIKKITLNWQANLSYYDFISLVPDFMAITAIFNNVNNQWLSDNLTTRDFDNMDIQWEVATGTPLQWAPVNFRYTAVYPRYASNAGTFDLYYWAVAPQVDDSASPAIPADMANLFTEYSTADLLEAFEEFSKANNFWNEYLEGLETFKERVQAINKVDLLIRI